MNPIKAIYIMAALMFISLLGVNAAIYCSNPFGWPGDHLWRGNDLYVCSKVGTWTLDY